MMKPTRVQLKRIKGWRMPESTKKVDRGTRWGNPFPVGSCVILFKLDTIVAKMVFPHLPNTRGVILDRRQAVDLFRAWLTHTEAGRQLLEQAKSELTGCNLACWCELGYPCHADVWLELLNGSE